MSVLSTKTSTLLHNPRSHQASAGTVARGYRPALSNGAKARGAERNEALKLWMRAARGRHDRSKCPVAPGQPRTPPGRAGTSHVSPGDPRQSERAAWGSPEEFASRVTRTLWHAPARELGHLTCDPGPIRSLPPRPDGAAGFCQGPASPDATPPRHPDSSGERVRVAPLPRVAHARRARRWAAQLRRIAAMLFMEEKARVGNTYLRCFEVPAFIIDAGSFGRHVCCAGARGEEDRS